MRRSTGVWISLGWSHRVNREKEASYSFSLLAPGDKIFVLYTKKIAADALIN